METVIDNLYFLELLKKIYELKEAGKEIPESLIRHTLDFGGKIDMSKEVLAFLEAIVKKPLLH